jgi:MFS family permease
MSSGVGQFVGPLFAGVFLQSADFTTYFYFCGAFVALSAVIILLFVKETHPGYFVEQRETIKGLGPQMKGLWGNIKSMGRVVAIFFVAVLIYRTGNTMVNPFFSLYLKDVLQIDISQTSYFFALRAMMTLTFAPITGYLLDRVGRKPVFLGGACLLIATMLGYRSVSTYDQVLIIRALESVSNAVLSTTTRTYVADLLRPEVRGFGMGLYMTIVDESSTMGALVGGWIAEVYDFGTIFLIGAVTATACLGITFVGVPEPSQMEHDRERAEAADVAG